MSARRPPAGALWRAEPGLAAPRPSWTDSHCHLDQCGDAGGVLEAAAAVGIDRVVAVSQDADSMQRVLDLAARFPGRVLPGLGLHPCTVTAGQEAHLLAALELLERRASEAAVIGETGLDFKVADDEPGRAEQRRVLERHFEIAAAHGKPVNLHSRRSLRQTLEGAVAFHRDTGLGAQMHWFTHSKKLVGICNAEGIFVSVGPAILSDPQAAAVACEVADELLLLESDAPVPVGGVAGHPRRVRHVAERLAVLRGVEIEALAARLETNLRAYLAADGPAPSGSTGGG